MVLSDSGVDSDELDPHRLAISRYPSLMKRSTSNALHQVLTVSSVQGGQAGMK